jgi:simple sugar transport system substrate-binding protein
MKETVMLRSTMALGASTAVALTLGLSDLAFAQVSGGVDQTVGGTPFQEAAKPAPETTNFHSDDGRLTFAIISHTAGNGFFDPAYVGAQVAADAFGINLIKLGPEAPIDDYPRQFEIINQVLQDPTIDGLAITTGQAGAYDDVVRKADELGIPVATFNSWDPGILDRDNISHTGQHYSAAAIGGRAMVECILESGAEGGSILFPNTTTMGNVEVNNRTTSAFEAAVEALDAAGKLGDFVVDAGPENIGIDVDQKNLVGSVVSLIESRGDVVGLMGTNAATTPAIGDAVAQLGMQDEICSFGFDLGPKMLDQIKTGALDGSLGQQPFLQGFYPIVQLYLQIDRGVAAADLDTKAQLVTQENVEAVGKRFEN